MDSLSSQWMGLRHERNSSRIIGKRRLWSQSHMDKLQFDLSSLLTVPGTGPVCLCPVRKGWGGRRDASGTSPPHWSPGRRAHHRPEFEKLGPSHTADLCSRCCMAQLHRSAFRQVNTQQKFHQTVWNHLKISILFYLICATHSYSYL